MRVRGIHIRMEGTGVKSVNENIFFAIYFAINILQYLFLQSAIYSADWLLIIINLCVGNHNSGLSHLAYN